MSELKAMAQGAEKIRCDTAGEPVSAEPLPARAVRWFKKHRRTLGSYCATAALLALFAFGMAMADRARRLDAVSLAQFQLDLFRQEAEKAFFFASGGDAVDEIFLDFELPSGAESARAALATAGSWGDKLERLPLAADERERVRREMYELLLLTAQIRIRRFDDATSLAQALGHLEQAREYGEPSVGFYRLEAECLRALGRNAEAVASQQRAEDPETSCAAFDHFLWGEQHRATARSRPPDGSGNEFAQQPNLDAAIAEYRAALEQDPDHYWSLLQLARCYLHTRDSQRWAESIGMLRACIVLQPESPRNYSVRGAALALGGRYDEALGDLNRALEIDGEYLPAQLHRGCVYWRQGELSKAITDFQEVWEAPEDVRQFQAAYYLGQLYLQQADYDGAAGYLTHYVALDRSLRQAFHDLACAEYLREQPERGREQLDKFLELGSTEEFDPDSAAVRLKRGRFLRNLAALPSTPPVPRKMLFRLAVQEFQQIKRADRTTDYFYDIGTALHVMGELPRAANAFSVGLEQDPGDLRLRNRRGFVYFRLGRLDEAIQDYCETAYGSNSKAATASEQALVAEAHAMLGCIRAAQQNEQAGRDVIRALLALRKLDRASKHEFRVWHSLACVFGKLSDEDARHRGEYQDLAIELLAIAVELARGVSREAYEAERAAIEKEPYLGAPLRERFEFRRLLADATGALPLLPSLSPH